MTLTIDNDLYIRGAATLLAAWEEYARGSARAAVRRLSGVAAAVFPSDPERAVYNNTLLDRDLGPGPGRALRFRVADEGTLTRNDLIRGTTDIQLSTIEDVKLSNIRIWTQGGGTASTRGLCYRPERCPRRHSI